MTTPQNEMRAKFELFVKNRHMLLLKSEPGYEGEYEHPWTAGAWAAWQAATAAQAEALAAVTRERDALRDATQWQPIETAPQDGTVILLAQTDDQPITASWDDKFGWMDNARGSWWGFEATQWMPIPARTLTPTAPGAQEQA